MKLTVKGEFFEAIVEGETEQDVWRKAAFWHSLPTTCPMDDTATRFGYARRGGFDFYYLESTGTPKYEFRFGSSTDVKGGLFPGEYEKAEEKTYCRWTYWDGERQWVVWENGRLASTDELVKQLDSLGIQAYSTGWPEKRTHNANKISTGRTSKAEELKIDELLRLITGLRRLVNMGKK
jgi:hypothetical protein